MMKQTPIEMLPEPVRERISQLLKLKQMSERVEPLLKAERVGLLQDLRAGGLNIGDSVIDQGDNRITLVCREDWKDDDLRADGRKDLELLRRIAGDRWQDFVSVDWFALDRSYSEPLRKELKPRLTEFLLVQTRKLGKSLAAVPWWAKTERPQR